MALLREEVRVDFPPKPSVSQLTFLSSYPLFLVTAQESLRQGGWGLRLGRPDCDTEGNCQTSLCDLSPGVKTPALPRPAQVVRRLTGDEGWHPEVLSRLQGVGIIATRRAGK